jgi:two-component system CheB/CheR fusion protein
MSEDRPHKSDPVRRRARQSPLRAKSAEKDVPVSNQPRLAGLCQRLVLEAYAPAAVLIDHENQCLYSLGATDRYLQVPSGSPTIDLLAMARKPVRVSLRSVLHRARQENRRIVVSGCQVAGRYEPDSVTLDVRPVPEAGEGALLVCFVEEPTRKDPPRSIRKSEREVNQEQAAFPDIQLSEARDRLDALSRDLDNVLYNIDAATIILDKSLNIRYFTPAINLIFNLLPGDIGRPLADLQILAHDDTFLADAQTVLKRTVLVEKAIEAHSGAWYMRRIAPFSARDGGVEGVVMTFSDITERKHIANQIETAQRSIQLASFAKSRLLAATSHELRQPLQTLALLQGLLAKKVEGTAAIKLVAKLDETLANMQSMLNTLSDINQIEAGTARAEISVFPIEVLLHRLKEEFAYQAHALGVELRVVFCRCSIQSDRRLLEQMIRNLLSNALKYTKSGKILLGCRRRQGTLSVEIWDTGTGSPDEKLQAMFEKYAPLDKGPHGQGRGFGLDLSIVERLAKLLDHHVCVRSRHGKGSVFAVEILSSTDGSDPSPANQELLSREGPIQIPHPQDMAMSTREPVKALGSAIVFVVDDDMHVRETIRNVLEDEGRTVEDYPSCEAFLEAYHPGSSGCLLVDAYLPGMSGLELMQYLRKEGHRLPTVMITGNSDVSIAVRAMKAGALDFIEKPVGRSELLASIERALVQSQDLTKLLSGRDAAIRHLAGLTTRQREIMDRVLAGQSSKTIAAELGISQRTVENHRASIMKKTGSRSLPALARLAMAAARNGH